MEKTDNELIAEFMGKEITGVQANFGERIKVYVLPDKPLSERKTGRSIEAKYETSWNWLMPVVEKIEGKGTIIEISFSAAAYCRICWVPNPKIQFTHESNSQINAAYEAVVEFIKWYNQTTTP